MNRLPRDRSFHFQHGFYEMWVTKALNGASTAIFSFWKGSGAGQNPGEICNRTAHARARGRGRAGRRGLYCVSRGLSAAERGVDSLL